MTEAQQAETGAQQALREDIIESAVRFLQDPKVQTSTLAKKISFLETKGLTNAEIEDALARAKGEAQQPTHGNTAVAANSTGAGAGYGYAQQMRPPAPPRPPLDWKDYFIAAVVAGGLGYGLFMLAKKYISPLLMVRDDNERLEEEKKLLLEQNEMTRKQLEALNESTTRVLEALTQQSQKTGEAVESMASAMDEIVTNGSSQRALSNRLLVAVEDLQREIASSKSTGGGEGTIADVQSDIRSLRSLLLSRRVPAHGASPAARPSTPSAAAAATAAADGDAPAEAGSDSPPSAASTATPTIPAWQLGLSEDSNNSK
ncbi:peroxisomal membrane protein pex14 [Coemansia sp. RSA 989]|nr:peroxisomal membrane anchor protein conserved region-domain-containing protein [Coemansia mojavensis]KAJ1739172.1 peroxisomal membrane protein pex14 [Coemansia sp. RSA 1086]KAJ1747527.1 peroxisomal membrane protein pex14 [Coemansia sp. RSA 1821]KAJ1861549.1 peroxisomal membrane protein pex14 [Coemansia sp. RSA 989]KAJ2667816.1 peroxisomal membrane protein pex14 [Coemansia sp. RSA 1085]